MCTRAGLAAGHRVSEWQSVSSATVQSFQHAHVAFFSFFDLYYKSCICVWGERVRHHTSIYSHCMETFCFFAARAAPGAACGWVVGVVHA